MTAPKTISIDGTDYVRVSDLPTTPKGDKRIVVLQRGWVVVGDRKLRDDGDYELTNASVIRVWGTTKGLGQLVNGPLPATRLDFAGTITYHPLTAVLTMVVEADKW